MNYRNIIFICIFIFLSNCTTETLVSNKLNTTIVKGYSNKGFALIYNQDLYDKKIVSKKIDERSLIIFQRNIKMDTLVKITNILNKKTIIVKVGKDSNYPIFNNTVLSKRIANELELDLEEPYIEIKELSKNSSFIAKKAKTFDEEKNVARKAPVKSISINDLNAVVPTTNNTPERKFSYKIKIADFYFHETAKIMTKRIVGETKIKNPKIKKINKEKYRVYLGPFNNINSLQKSFNDIKILEFENIEIIRND